jgi:hypothetical protein
MDEIKIELLKAPKKILVFSRARTKSKGAAVAAVKNPAMMADDMIVNELSFGMLPVDATHCLDES